MSSKPPIAVWSPTPPIRSGVADSTFELLLALRDTYAIEIFIDEGYVPNPEVTVSFPVHSFTEYETRNQEHPFAVTLHELGNSLFHLYQYLPMQRHQNVIVSLHDLTWGQTLFYAYAKQGHYTEFRQEIAPTLSTEKLTEYDESFIALREGDAGPINQFLHHNYLLGKVIECSRLQIIRLDMVDELVARYPNAKPHFIRPMPKPIHGDKVQARQALEIHPDTFVVGVFGYVARTKRVEKVIAAFCELLITHPNSQLVIVGPFFEEAYADELKELAAPIMEHIVMTGFVEKPIYEQYLVACDVVVGLRWPWAGEASRPVNQAVSAGKPIIITDLPKWNDYPPDFTWRVGIDENEVPMLTGHLKWLATDSTLLEQASRRARQWVVEQFNFEGMVAAYREVIDSLVENEGEVS